MLKTRFLTLAATFVAMLVITGSANAGMTDTKFAVDGTMINPVSNVSYVEEGMQGTHKFFLEFYAFPMNSQEEKDAALGNKDIIRNKMPRTENGVDAYNRSNAKLIVTVSEDYKTIYQVDMAIPGYTCTIAQYTNKAPDFAQAYSFDGKIIHLVSKGSNTCFGGKHKFFWSVNLTAPVYAR